MSNNFKPLHKQVAEKLIAELKAGTSPFQKPWKDGPGTGFALPMNPTTGKNYRGMNALWLAMQHREDPRWMTLKQASFNRWTVEAGAKATLISFSKTSDIKHILDEKGELVLDENGKVQTQVVQLEKPVLTNAWVFNGEQIRGIPPWEQILTEQLAEQTWIPIARAENIVIASQAQLEHGGNEAFYHALEDKIQLPQKQQFESAAQYYATLLHELGHWTGHPTRMNRPMGNHFGSQEYAREELRAEIASLMIGSELQIGHLFGQHAAYVDAWISVLENDPQELFNASRDAQKIFDYITGIEQKWHLAISQEAKRPAALLKNDVISYKQTAYKVVDAPKGKSVKLENLESSDILKVSPRDGLYRSLLEARDYPVALRQADVKENPREIIAEDLGKSVSTLKR